MNDFSCSVALIPGFMLDETLWDEFIDHLPEEWTVYRSQLGDGETIREMASQIVAHLTQRLLLGRICRQATGSRFPRKSTGANHHS